MKIADRLRLCAPPHKNWGSSQALCSPMMKIADSLRLCAPPSRKLGDVSGSVQPHDENGRQSQALGSFCALHSPKLGDVSGFLHPHDELVDSLRLSAHFVQSTHENCGASQALCTPHAENCRPSKALSTFCTLHSRKLWGVSGSWHPHDEFADSLRLSAHVVHSTDENCGTPQALCTPMLKKRRQSQALSVPPREKWGTSQALCSPMMKIADSLRLCAPPLTKIGGRLRLCAAP